MAVRVRVPKLRPQFDPMIVGYGKPRIIGLELRVVNRIIGHTEELFIVGSDIVLPTLPADARWPDGYTGANWEYNGTVHTSGGDSNFSGLLPLHVSAKRS